MEGLDGVLCGGYFAVLVGVVGLIEELDIEEEGGEGQGRDGLHYIAYGMVLWRSVVKRGFGIANVQAYDPVEKVALFHHTSVIS